jgi:hypothetical protein
MTRGQLSRVPHFSTVFTVLPFITPYNVSTVE